MPPTVGSKLTPVTSARLHSRRASAPTLFGSVWLAYGGRCPLSVSGNGPPAPFRLWRVFRELKSVSAFLGNALSDLAVIGRLASLGGFAALRSDFPFRDHDRGRLVTGRSARQRPLGWGNEDDWVLAATPRGGARRLSPRSLPPTHCRSPRHRRDRQPARSGPANRGRIRDSAADSGCDRRTGAPKGLPAICRPSDRDRPSGSGPSAS